MDIELVETIRIIIERYEKRTSGSVFLRSQHTALQPALLGLIMPPWDFSISEPSGSVFLLTCGQ